MASGVISLIDLDLHSSKTLRQGEPQLASVQKEAVCERAERVRGVVCAVW